MDWIATAPVFLVWCGDMRRNQRLCEQHGMPHANNNLDTFLNTAVDCSLAMGQFIAAAEAIGLGTCPISYVRSHIERVTPLLSLPPGVYPVSGLCRRLAGVPPPRVDAPAAVCGGAPRTLRRSTAGRRNPRLRRTPRRARTGGAGSLKNNDVYPPREGVGWSENVARQLSVPERFGFAAYLRTRGFDLA